MIQPLITKAEKHIGNKNMTLNMDHLAAYALKCSKKMKEFFAIIRWMMTIQWTLRGQMHQKEKR